MAQTLRYRSELVAGAPDNTSGLIDAIQLRDMVVSMASGNGAVETTADVTIPIVSGTPVAVNPLLTGVSVFGSLWGADGNSFLFPNYSAVLTDTTIPAGYTKFCRFQAMLALTKQGGGTDTYSIQFTRNGVLVGDAHDVLFSGTDTDTITVPYFTNQDVGVADTFGVSVTGVGTGDDLVLESFSMDVADELLDAAP